MGLVLSTKNLILKELSPMTKHEGLRAWAQRGNLADKQNKARLYALRRNKRIIRVLIIQTELGAEL